MEIKYKGKPIHTYESFYWNTTESFNRGELGGGICRCIKTDDSLATLVMEEMEILEEQKEVEYRIRKLTPRECFRLMGVEDKDIDKIQNAGISNSQQYKLAGNSIVVDVLYHIFRKMFIEKESESNELTLF